MFIEDLIYSLYINCKVNKFDSPVLSSFVFQNSSGIGFTEKQSLLALKILKRYQTNLKAVIKIDIGMFLDNPNYKYPIRKTNTSKKIQIIEHPKWIKAIKVEFPFNNEKIDIIRKNKLDIGFAVWDSDQKAWIFSLDEKNIKFLHSFIDNEEYEIDAEFKNYLEQYENIVNSLENYVPMIILKDDRPEYVNVSKFVPKLQSTDIVTALFEARKAGIFTWNESISTYLDKINLNQVVRTFLSNENPHFLEIDSSTNSIDCLADIIKFTKPILFVIPGGSELQKTEMIFDFLIKLGYSNDEMSVMFRLPNKDSKNFNDFVRSNKLNNPISEKTKFVLVSIKLPKPIISSKMKFNSVISLGRINVHYTIRDFFKNRENLIFFCEPNKQKELNFVNL
jgi:hypothetical protein